MCLATALWFKGLKKTTFILVMGTIVANKVQTLGRLCIEILTPKCMNADTIKSTIYRTLLFCWRHHVKCLVTKYSHIIVRS